MNLSWMMVFFSVFSQLQLITKTRSLVLLFLLSGGYLVLPGCGYQTYERRLQESRLYFAYLEKLNVHLDPPLQVGVIEELRLPIGFRQVKAIPNASEEQEGDPRQPAYLGIELPGLLATFRAELDVSTADAQARKPGFVYVLSNAELLRTDPDTAANFTQHVMNQICDAVGLPQVDPTKATVETYPRVKTYVAPKTFQVYRLTTDTELEIDEFGWQYTMELYSHHQGDIDVVLMFVLPVGIGSHARLSERLPLMFERLKISARLPTSSRKAQGTTSSPTAPTPPTAGF